MSSRIYDPESPLLSGFRALEDYLRLVMPSIYDIEMSFPDTTKIGRSIAFPKTLIHFELDAVRSTLLGMGDNVVDYYYNEIANTVDPIEGAWHEFDIDVGIWASADSGGTTARMAAWQELTKALHGPGAEENVEVLTEGLQIISFEGGLTFVDSINDLPIWRMRDMTLTILAAGKKVFTPLPVVIDWDITSDLYVDEEIIITD